MCHSGIDSCGRSAGLLFDANLPVGFGQGLWSRNSRGHDFQILQCVVGGGFQGVVAGQAVSEAHGDGSCVEPNEALVVASLVEFLDGNILHLEVLLHGQVLKHTGVGRIYGESKHIIE